MSVIQTDYVNSPSVSFSSTSNQSTKQGSFQPQETQNFMGYSLSGEPINTNTFTHNNMTPFFGSHVRQNMDEYSTSTIVQNYTGQDNYYTQKAEMQTMFQPEHGVGNPYGTSNLAGYQRNRYIPSNKRTNEAPTEKVYVGPGLNKGYVSTPSGGFHQADTRNYMLPKNVDELRVKTNPKLSYHIPVIAGSKPEKRGNLGQVNKNRPDTYAEWTPDRYFITTGDRVKPTQHAEVVLKHSNRTTTDIRRAMGPAGPKNGHSESSRRSQIRVSNKEQYTPGCPRGANVQGQWTIPENEPIIENYVPMKPCSSETFSSLHQQTRMKNKPIYENDPRLQRTSLHDYGRGGMQLQTNVREQTSCHPVSNMTGNEHNYVPITSELRSTRKQNVVGNTRWVSNVQMPNSKPIAWDPNDTPDVTMKETLLAPSVPINFTSNKPSLPPAHDPNDVLQTTTKETTMTEYSGNVYQPTQDKRHMNTFVAPTTYREMTSDTQYVGNANGNKEGGYQYKKIDPRYTNRQYTSNNSYTGNVSSNHTKPVNQDVRNNITSKSYRDSISQGRTPATSGPKENIDSSMIYATTNRSGDLQNAHLEGRETIANKSFFVTPQMNMCENTTNRKTVSNDIIYNRMDEDLIKEFVNNPYTQSLQSYY